MFGQIAAGDKRDADALPEQEQLDLFDYAGAEAEKRRPEKEPGAILNDNGVWISDRDLPF